MGCGTLNQIKQNFELENFSIEINGIFRPNVCGM